MRWLVILVVLAAPGLVLAQESPPDIPPGEDRLEHLQQGVRAPYAGMLLDTDTAIRWTNRLRWYQEEFRLRLRAEEQTLQAVRASHATELRIVEESYRREIQGLRNDVRDLGSRLAQAMDRPWYDTVAFGIGVGALIVVLLGVAAVGLYAAIAS